MKYLFIILVLIFARNLYAQEPIKDSATGKFYFVKETANGMEPVNNILYEEVSSFFTSYALAKLNGKWYVLNQKFESVRGPFDYADRESFDYNGEAAVCSNGNWNLLNYKNKLIFRKAIPDSNFFYSPFDLSYFFKTKDRVYYAQIRKNKWIDATCKKDSTPGEPAYYDCPIDGYLTFGANGLAAVKKEKYGYINANTNLIIPFIYDYADNFNNSNTAVVKQKNSYGYIDSSGKQFISFMFDNAKPFTGTVAAVQKGYWYGLINKERKTVAPFDYNNLDCIDNAGMLYNAQKDSKNGIIDSNNHIVIPFDYDGDFVYINQNCFIAKKNGYYGLINIIQRKLVPFNYAEYSVKLKTKNLIIFKAKEDTKNPYHIYNNFGDKRNDQGYQYIDYFYGDRSKVQRNEKYGFIDASGYEVIPCEYDEVGSWSNETCKVKKDGKKFLIDKNGQKVTKK